MLIRASDLPRIGVFASEDLMRRIVRRRVYRRRRLPKLSRHTIEIVPVKKWISYALQEKALVIGDRNCAYEIMRETFKMHSIVNGQSSYAGFPDRDAIAGSQRQLGRPRQEQENELDHSSDNSIETETMPEITDARNEGQLDSQHAVEPRDPAEESARIQQGASSSLESVPPQGTVVSGPNRCFSILIRRIANTARNDQLFRFLCRIVDVGWDGKIGMIAGSLMALIRNEEPEAYPLMADVSTSCSVSTTGQSPS